MPSRRTLATTLALSLIIACLAAEAAVLRVGIDDLDEGYFVQQGVRVLHGQIPYKDFQTLYTPGLAYAHAALFGVLGGQYLVPTRALALAARGGLALLLFVMARPLVRQPLWAALPGVFLLVGLDDAPVLWEPHPGWLSTLFAVAAAWCVSHRLSKGWLIAAGVAAGAAYVFKQNTGAFILAAILIWGLAPGAGRLKGVLLPFGSFAAFTILWLAPLLVALRGDVSLLGVFVGAVNQAGLFSGPEWPVLIPLLCLAGGVWVGRQRGAEPRARWYLLAGGALFLTEYPRMDALHLAWSAPLLLVSGAVALDRLRWFLAWPMLAITFALTGPTMASRVAAIQQPLVPITTVPYAAGIEVPAATRTDIEGVVAEIQARTKPGEPIFVYPTSPLLYPLAERPNPTRFDHLNPGAADPRQIDQVIHDLETGGVRLVVISDFWQAAWGPPGPNAVLDAWLAAHFTEVARYGAYRVLTSGL